MVSGDASAVLIRSLFNIMELPLRRVTSIIAVDSFAEVIGGAALKVKNLKGNVPKCTVLDTMRVTVKSS
jgi:hypothetical protein